MIKISALCKDTFKDILVNPDSVICVLPVFIKGDTVDMTGAPVDVERAMLIMSNSQQLIIDATVNDYFLGLNNADKEN